MAQAYSEGVDEPHALAFLTFIAPLIRNQLQSGGLDYANHGWFHERVDEFKGKQKDDQMVQVTARNLTKPDPRR